MMKIYKFILTIFFILLFSFSLFGRNFIIEDYNVNIILLKNSSAQIEENILVNFLYPKRGIIRFIPYRYKKNFLNFNLRINIISVESSFNGEDYNPEPYKVYKKGRNIFIRIGKIDKYYKGLKYYKILYTVKNSIKFYKNHDEFYWNVIGTNWDTIIKNANFTIDFPEVNKNNIYAKVYIGKFGNKQILNNFNLTNDELYLLEPIFLEPHTGITVGISFPKGIFNNISPIVTFFWFLWDNIGYFILFTVFIIMFIIWWKIGKDEKGGTIVVRYYPPRDLTPAEVGTIIDDKVDLRDIISTILDFGAKGYLKIVKRNDGVIEFIKNKENIPVFLKPHEKIIYDGLFGLSDIMSIKAMKGYFSETVERAKDALYDFLTNKEKYFSINPDSIRNLFKQIGIITIFAGVFIFFYCLIIERIDIGIGLIVSGLIILIFSRIMPQKTFKGAKIYREILGFKEFLERAEKPVLEKLIKQDPLYFSKNLPYAVALNLEKNWTEKFDGLDAKMPEWYVSPFLSKSYSPIIFYSTLSNDLNTLEKEIIIKPSGESSFETIDSTGGIFTSNGGFSGGGFGGGGGSSW